MKNAGYAAHEGRIPRQARDVHMGHGELVEPYPLQINFFINEINILILRLVISPHHQFRQ